MHHQKLLFCAKQRLLRNLDNDGKKDLEAFWNPEKRGWNMIEGHSSTDCCHWVLLFCSSCLLIMAVVTSVIGQHVVIMTTATSLFLTTAVIFERRVGPSTLQ